MEAKKGSLSISSENIFPIIKKWVYSDHDIFAREMVSNGCDAITKLKKLDMMGEYQLPDGYKPVRRISHHRSHIRNLEGNEHCLASHQWTPHPISIGRDFP